MQPTRKRASEEELALEEAKRRSIFDTHDATLCTPGMSAEFCFCSQADLASACQNTRIPTADSHAPARSWPHGFLVFSKRTARLHLIWEGDVACVSAAAGAPIIRAGSGGSASADALLCAEEGAAGSGSSAGVGGGGPDDIELQSVGSLASKLHREAFLIAIEHVGPPSVQGIA